MKKLITNFLADRSKNKETFKKIGSVVILNPILIILMTSWITLLSSCGIIFPVPGVEGYV